MRPSQEKQTKNLELSPEDFELDCDEKSQFAHQKGHNARKTTMPQVENLESEEEDLEIPYDDHRNSGFSSMMF